MSNLPNNTTVDGLKIITSSDENNHRHDASQIQGLNENATGDAFVYAERIDGVTYSTMQNRFISESVNTMTGTLNISSNSTSPQNIINSAELDTLKLNNGILEYSITDLPTVEEVNTAQTSIMVTGSNSSIDLSWLPSASSSSYSSISLSGGPITVSSGTTYQFNINNYNSFDTYSTSISTGTASIDNNGVVNVNTPPIAPNQETITLTVSNISSSESKTITFTMLADLDVIATYSTDNTTYGPIPQGGITVDDEITFYLRIEEYDPNYTYNVTSFTPDFSISRNADIITVVTPVSNDTAQSGNITIDRGDSVFNVPINYNIYNINEWTVSTYGGDTKLLFPYSIKILDDNLTTNNLLVVGSGRVDGGFNQAEIVKMNSDLTSFNTQKEIGGSDNEAFSDIIDSYNGGYVAVGREETITNNAFSAFIVEYDSLLDVVQQKAYSTEIATTFQSIIKDGDGGYIVAGSDFSIGTSSTMLIKFDANLNLVAQKRINNASSNSVTLLKIIESGDGGGVGIGSINDSDRSGYIIKFDKDLNVTIEKELEGTSSGTFAGAGDERFNDVTKTPTGYVVCGTTGSHPTLTGIHPILCIYDDQLNIISINVHSNVIRYDSCNVKDDGTIVAVGAGGDSEGIISEFDSNGNHLRSLSLTSPSYTVLFRAISKSPDGTMYAVGNHRFPSGNYRPVLIKLPNDISTVSGTISNHPEFVWATPTGISRSTITLTEKNAVTTVSDISRTIQSTSFPRAITLYNLVSSQST